MAKKSITMLLVLLFLSSLCMVPVFGSDGQPEFFYELTVDGKDYKDVDHGDIITLNLYLHRTDTNEPFTMHSMQDELRYDSQFFELVSGSEMLARGIESTDIGLLDNHREFYMNYLTFGSGITWQPSTRVGSFQLRVIGTTGVSTISNEDYLVSFPDGSGSYDCEANEVRVFLSTDCLVQFETNGGSEIKDIIVKYNKAMKRPKDPVREGMHLEGWYKDIHLTEAWDFDKDIVTENMTLYAKWAEGNPVRSGMNLWLWWLLILAGISGAYRYWKTKQKK